jgi:hypothetical protein
MNPASPHSSKSHWRAALLLSVLSLPFIMGVDNQWLVSRQAPSTLALALAFLFLLTGPALAWFFSWRSRDALGRAALAVRWGESRRTFILREAYQRCRVLGAVLFGLGSWAIVSHYGALDSRSLGELGVLLPIALTWTALLVFVLGAVHAWLGRAGLLLLLIVYAWGLGQSVTEWDAVQLGPLAQHGWLASPLLHLSQLLGVMTAPVTWPAWLSFGCLALYASLGLWALLGRTPR